AIERIAQLGADLLGQRSAQRQRPTVGLAAERLIGVGRHLFGKQVDAGGNPAAHNVGLAQGKLDSLAVLAEAHPYLGVYSTAKKVGFTEPPLADESLRCRIAARNRELASVLLLHVDVDNRTIRCRARLTGDLHGLEVAKILEPPLGARNKRAIVGIALA